MDILFWSGGKDSYLAYQFYKKSYPDRSIVLLTTFNEKTETVPRQEIPIRTIKRQAERLNLSLYTVPLPPKSPNEIYLNRTDEALNQTRENVKRLIFGDWNMPDIQNWRKENFNNLGYECYFPLEEKGADELLAELDKQPVEVRISAVQKKFQPRIKRGELYDVNFIKQLPENVDPLGEKGEFHTEVIFL